jgi:hypothetical protein
MDLGQLAGVASRLSAGADLRAGADRIALSTRLLVPLLGAGGSAPTELANDLRAAVAGRDAVTLVLPAAAGQAARLEVGPRMFLLPPALRDALLSALAPQDSTLRPAAAAASTALLTAPVPTASVPTAATAADAARAWAVAAQTTAAAAGVVSGSGAPRAVQRARDDAPAPTVRFQQPLFEPVNATAPIAAASERMRHAVERSGVFFESHVAQWASGARDAAELRSEALRLLPGGGSDMSAQRVAAQVALLQEGVLRLEGPAWPGQPMSLAIQRDDAAPESAAPATGEPVFVARVALDLPHLGPIEIAVRLAGRAVSATVHSDHVASLAPALAELGARFDAAGLRPVMLRSVPADAEVH